MLSKEMKSRFSRQIIIPEIGEEGQERLSASKVLIAGLGGLGSISSYYMTAAGVGHLKIIDRDSVATDNLNRQILHNTGDIGRLKVDSAFEKLGKLNPSCRIEALHEDIESTSVLGFADGCSLIIDATDNLIARHSLNEISLKKNIPLIYGGIDGWTGMAMTFLPGITACFACVFPAEASENKKIFGALGPVVGTIASIQCVEAINILLGRKPGLAGRMLRFMGDRMEFKYSKVEKNRSCPVCNKYMKGTVNDS